MPRRRRLHALALSSLAIAGGVAGMGGCPGNPTPPAYTPYTGFSLQFQQLLDGLGCGTGPGQVYKYSAIVSPTVEGGTDAQSMSYSDVWDCYADGILENVPVMSGDDTFFIRVYAYSYAGALAAEQAQQDGAGGTSAEAGTVDPSFWCAGGLGPNGGTCPFETATYALALGKYAQWTATCTATETEGAPVTPICTALVAVGGSTGQDASLDAQPDVSAEALADSSGDSSDASVEGAAPEGGGEGAADATQAIVDAMDGMPDGGADGTDDASSLDAPPDGTTD